jgi:hypothetical protein
MSIGAPLHSAKLVKIIFEVAFWRDKSFSSLLGQYIPTLFWDEVGIFWDKIDFQLMGT